jgi:hypothetical protein
VEGVETVIKSRVPDTFYGYIVTNIVTYDMMRNTPPADEFPPQQPPVTTRGDLAVGFKV